MHEDGRDGAWQAIRWKRGGEREGFGLANREWDGE